MSQTIIKYQDTALPVQNTFVTLFNSAEAFPPGGSFHLLCQQWFQYSLLFDSSGSAATGVVQGQYSDDGGATWETFYASPTLTAALVQEDEVYVGMYKDVRFRFLVTNETEDTNYFSVNLALNPCKSTSKSAVGYSIVDGDATVPPAALVDSSGV
jgi:hypothetical protein